MKVTLCHVVYKKCSIFHHLFLASKTWYLPLRLAPLNRFKPSSKIFYWPFQGATSFVDLLCFCSVLCLLCLCAHLFICALERADLLALVCGVCCEFVTFPLVSWVRCGTWLYRFLIFAPLLTFSLIIFSVIAFTSQHNGMCVERWLRSASAYTQSDLSRPCPH